MRATFCLCLLSLAMCCIPVYGADPVKFTSKNGSYTLLTVNGATGATQTHTVKATVDNTVDMAGSIHNVTYSSTNSGNWKPVTLSTERKIMGVVTESGTKSAYRYIFYQSLRINKGLSKAGKWLMSQYR